MYLTFGAVFVGEALLFPAVTRDMLVLVPILWIVSTLFVMLYEEPTLRRLFGKDYEAYARNVHRWLPRFRPYVSGEASGSNIL